MGAQMAWRFTENEKKLEIFGVITRGNILKYKKKAGAFGSRF